MEIRHSVVQKPSQGKRCVKNHRGKNTSNYTDYTDASEGGRHAPSYTKTNTDPSTLEAPCTVTLKLGGKPMKASARGRYTKRENDERRSHGQGGNAEGRGTTSSGGATAGQRMARGRERRRRRRTREAGERRQDRSKGREGRGEGAEEEARQAELLSQGGDAWTPGPFMRLRLAGQTAQSPKAKLSCPRCV
jgi:hypothetical protein